VKILNIAALFAAAAGSAGRAEVLEFAIVDAATGSPVPARVRVRDAQGRDYVPGGAVTVPIGTDVWFAAAGGSVRLEMPEGKARVRVERGTEYVPYSGTVDVPGRQTKIALRRWVDMRAEGYRSGENHLHLPAAALPVMLAAEDLDFGNSLYWWNGPKLPRPPGAEAVRVMEFDGHRAPASVFDAEVEYNWGAVYLNGLQRPIEIAPERARSNLAFVREARKQGALISYQGGWSREVLFDALLGYVDVVNVCNNNFHRHKYQERPQYSNLLKAPGLPEYPGTAEGMMRLNTDSWYRLLNCGLRLAAGAESATGAKTTPPGYNRAYVKVAAGTGLREFYDAWRRGRNFVTNGPMVFLSGPEGAGPGETIALAAPGGSVRVKVRAVSDQPLRSLELVVNGRVEAVAKIARDATTAELEAPVAFREGGWIAARATAEDRLLDDSEMVRYDEPGRLGRTAPTRLRFGHTSPIYVTVGGAGARVESSVQEAGAMLAAFERFARESASPAALAEVLAAMPEAARKLN
jgi:hypothetical protein